MFFFLENMELKRCNYDIEIKTIGMKYKDNIE